jgi:hypothetical protein
MVGEWGRGQDGHSGMSRRHCPAGKRMLLGLGDNHEEVARSSRALRTKILSLGFILKIRNLSRIYKETDGLIAVIKRKYFICTMCQVQVQVPCINSLTPYMEPKSTIWYPSFWR